MARGRNPFELFMLSWCVVAGIGSLASPGPPQTLIAALPDWVVTGWAIILIACGATALIGVMLRSPSWGLLLERSALIPLAGAAFGYVIALWAVNGDRAFAFCVIVGAFGLAAAARAAQISWDVRRASTLQREAR